MPKTIFLLVSIFLTAAAALAESVGVKAYSDARSVSAGETLSINFEFSIPKGLHIYADKDVGELGQPTTIALSIPQGYKLKSIDFPPTREFEFLGIKSKGYSENFVAKASIQAPSKISEAADATISAKISWLACSNQCVPGDAKIALKFPQKISEIKNVDSAAQPVSAKSAQTAKTSATLAAADDDAGSGFWAIVAAAFLGGAILNLMPCVFPVIGLKIISFANGAKDSRREAVIGAMFYTFGILASFLALAGLLLALRAAGENLGWGFQLQNPAFTGLMALLFFAMGLSFAGMYEIGAGFAGGGVQDLDKSESKSKKYFSAILSGVAAVLVASPCTAPFMGTAMGAALASDASATLCIAVFAALGLGMAAPYVLLSAIPALARAMPRPGQWMEVLKQILSIPLFASVIWLIWVYGLQTNATPRILTALLILTIGAKIFGSYYRFEFSKAARIWAAATFAICALFAIWITVDSGESEASETIVKSAETSNVWSPERVQKLRSEGKIVYVDFTASWCLTCQYNKQILESKSVRDTFKKNSVAVLIGDWTNKNPQITAELEKFGRAGVPLNIVYSPRTDTPPEVLPAILTPAAVIEAIDKSKL